MEANEAAAIACRAGEPERAASLLGSPASPV